MVKEGEIKIEGTVRSLVDQTTRKKGVRKMQGKVVIMNEEADRIDITSDPSILNGFNPEDAVEISIKRTQKTIDESLAAEKDEKKDKK